MCFYVVLTKMQSSFVELSFSRHLKFNVFPMTLVVIVTVELFFSCCSNEDGHAHEDSASAHGLQS